MNILVLTTIYQQPDDAKDSATTPVVHNFAKEWVKQGHNVFVIHNSNMYLRILYHLPKSIKDKLANRLGFRVSLNLEQRKEINYIKDGIKINRVPIFKEVPMGAYSERQLRKQLTRIISLLEENRFVPDVIVAHAENPQIYQLFYLKKEFPKVKTSLVFHGIEYLQRKKFSTWKNQYMSSIDAYGFRSKNLVRKARAVIDFDAPYFMCPSGIANEYVEHEMIRSSSNMRRILFVGQLIERKHPKTIFEAIDKLGVNYEVSIVGDGSLRADLERFAIEKKINATFHGKIRHEEVLEEMRNSDIFVMLSENEVFGLVYLEAMSQGCITIASEREGMEGIIRDGENGYLAPAGDTEALVHKLQIIDKMAPEEIHRIQHEAFVTAKEYSETVVAQKYLQAVMDS